MSGGLWFAVSARTRRTLVLLWTALFLCSLLMQSACLRRQPRPRRPQRGSFRARRQRSRLGGRRRGLGERSRRLGRPVLHRRRDEAPITTSPTSPRVAQGRERHSSLGDHGQLRPGQGRAARRLRGRLREGGDTWVYFGADRFDAEGDAQIGFWFFQDEIGIANGDFTGEHVDGDVLILAEYTNGGVVT